MLRFGWIVALTCVVGCWSDDDTVNGLTAEQWQRLKQDLTFPPNVAFRDICAADGIAPGRCADAHDLGQALFNDTGLSSASDDPTVCDSHGGISCHTCHSGPGLIDPRIPNMTSQTVKGWTSRNSMSLLNERYKWLLANGAEAFTWSGGSAPDQAHHFNTPGQVARLAIEKPMNSTGGCAVSYVLGRYGSSYTNIFPNSSSFDSIEKLFDVYLITNSDFQTNTTTPFDRWLNDEPSAMSDSAKRGFSLFVGKAGCISCHSGPLLSDLDFHNTGVPQDGNDAGRAKVTMDAADTGKFLTGTLRDIASTGPYMHNGSIASLAEVIAFYRSGGGNGGYLGTRDLLIQPLDLTDQDAADLEAFLRSLSDCDDDKSCGSGSGTMKLDAGVDAALPDSGTCGPPPFTQCPMGCVDIAVDPSNCGTCGHVCTYPTLNCSSFQCVQ